MLMNGLITSVLQAYVDAILPIYKEWGGKKKSTPLYIVTLELQETVPLFITPILYQLPFSLRRSL